MASRRKSRGRRQMGEVTVKTFTEFEKPKDSVLTEERGSSSSKDNSKESTPASIAGSSTSSTSNDHIKFISGNPFVEVTKGVLHLYKEKTPTSLEEGVIRSQMICMLSVPSKMKTPDLLQFTAPCHEQLESMRIIQDSSPNQYMVLLKFR